MASVDKTGNLIRKSVIKPPTNPNSARLKTSNIERLLARRYHGVGWAIMFELKNNIGQTQSRADAIAVDSLILTQQSNF